MATARVLMLMGLGQTVGPENGLQSILLDGVPVANSDGSLNFERGYVEWRIGTQDQDRIDGFSEIETEYGVGVEVKTTTPATRQIDDLDADAVRVTVSVPALLEVNSSNGDTYPTSVEVAVDLKPAIGAWVEAKRITISGKTRSKYQRSVRVPLDGAGPWQVRVRRITADSSTQNRQNITTWDSYTVINDAPLRYPNYALLGLRFDAKAFSSFPKIEVRWKLAVLQVPSNYDPATRSCSGAWDGTFKPAWSDNPAWWLWTYATDSRYNVNIPPGAWKWDLYRIAQWCDQLVSDGQGGARPRFTCNFIQSESVDAWKVLQDIASVFCGRVLPFAGGVRVTADIPGDVPAKHFMPANVKEGRFTYSSTELADRQTVAVVSFVDPDDSDKRATEYVEHTEGLALYGYQPAEVAAVGCTNRAQAQQLGRYILETAQSETEMVSFGTGTYGMDLMPGELFYVADPTVSGGRFGGRLLGVDGVAVLLDAPVLLSAGVSYSLEVPMPDGTLVRRGVTNVASMTSSLVLVAPFPDQPVEGATWLLVATNVQPTLWRCVRNAEAKDNPGEREISGVQHDPNKWQRIDQGIRVAPPPSSLISGEPEGVRGVLISESLREVDKAVINVADVSWQMPGAAARFEVAWRMNGGNWATGTVYSPSFEILRPGAGDLEVRITCVDVLSRRVMTMASAKLFGLTKSPESLTGLDMAPFNGFALLSWPQSPDIDVRVGGVIRIRHSPLLSGALWDSATDVGPSIPGSATQATLPLLSGTYLAKPVDSGGRESGDAVSVSTNAPAIMQFNAVEALVQHPGFAGQGAGCIGIDGRLKLVGVLSMDDWPDVDSLPSWDTAGGVIPRGEYVFDRLVDLGSIDTCRITAAIETEGYLVTDVMDSWGDVDSRQSWDGSPSGLTAAVIEISTTDGDPALGDWSAWSMLRIGDYRARAFRFRVVQESFDPLATVDVLALSVTVDMPDRIVEYADLAVPVDGLRINFSPPFRSIPAVGVTAQGLQPGEYVEITARTKAGFFIAIKNASGQGVQRTADVIAKGYGYDAA
ncbi:host specificity protein J [Pseudogulbenkiania sp. NH8B]|uniref:host specificity protein J n=1 Tax=Pseudogulbenkiania sp. (strain NH8B) TaxID=748280 RepID=UPI00130D7F8B|nr:phage tail protein [Pseudogulbenkiania sp. NH8B]